MKRDIKLYLNTLLHPIGGFEDICEAKCFSVKSSILIFVFFFVSQIIDRQLVGFSFSTNNTKEFNIVLLLVGTLALLLLWTISNWMVTTLFEGKGKVKEIWTVTLTATIPYSFSLLLHAILTNIIITDEAIFLEYVMILGILWSVVLLLCGLIVLHDFSFSKVIWTTILTVLFMAVIVFLTVILYSLFQQIYSFVIDLIDEIKYRL